MFAKRNMEKETVTTGDDMASVSTFTTNAETRWGSKVDDASSGASAGSKKSKRSRRQKAKKNEKASVVYVAVMIIILGLAAAAFCTYFGYRAESNGRQEDFERGAFQTVAKIRDTFDEYVDTASLIHGRFRDRPRFNLSAYENDPARYMEEYMEWSAEFRQDFRELYEYVRASGLKFKAMQYDPNITDAERPMAEAEIGSYLAENYPEVNYTGFRGFNGDATSLEPRWRNQSFYFPIHYMEPISGNEAAIDLDYYSSESRIRAVDALFETEGPSLTDRLSLVKQAGSKSRCISADGGFTGDGPSYGVVLMHPGVRLSDDTEEDWPEAFSSLVICMPDLIKRSTDHQARRVSVYIHDLSHPKDKFGEPVFMGAARLGEEPNAGGANDLDKVFTMRIIGNVTLEALNAATKGVNYQNTITVANRQWTVTIVDEHGADSYRLFYVAIVGLVVFGAFVCLAVWVLATDRKNRTYAALKARAAQERNQLVLENANRAAAVERELNDFLAHEVRNPLSAAMAATQFLRTELDRKSRSSKGIHVHFEEGDHDEEENKAKDYDDESQGGSTVRTLSSPRLVQAREDVRTVDHALRFINDLLRNMLDMHRASSGKLQVKFAPTDLLHDVLEPVAGMLHRGGEGRLGRGKGDEKVKIVVDCPDNIVVETDVLRLKQVVLNLGRNSVKFINEGFIRLRAEVVEVEVDEEDPSRFRDEFEKSSGHCDLESAGSKSKVKSVRIYVEDSGVGIPEEKRERLFAKYQESLDLLSQGTGIGLHLCKNLVELMGGEISLDNDYKSGIADNPGARFVVDLQSAPIDPSLQGESIVEDRDGSIRVNFSGENGEPFVCFEEGKEGTLKSVRSDLYDDEEDDDELLPDLPSNLNVLFVDDDRVLRKLFGRTIKTVAPDWSIREAANGETAILLAQEEKFDLIFCDMYMASVEKQLLGTETVAEMRSQGIKSRICGLSANDKEQEFLEAGSDAFLFKPIPCQSKILRKTLHRVLYGEDQKQGQQWGR